MRVVIFSGGNVEDGFFVRKSLKHADLIIAADSGYESALKFSTKPTILVGDLDSLKGKILKQVQDDKNVEIVSSNPQKDETDTQLGVDIAIKKGATEICILGGVAENRIDHVLGNVFLSAYANVPLYFINGNQKTWIENGPAKVTISGNKGDLLSLIPLSEKVENVTTENLQYALKNQDLVFGIPRGISNVFLDNFCSVSFKKGRLLFVQTNI